MSAGVLKQVELTKAVGDLGEVPYLNLGQEIQSRKNLVRYYKLLGEVKTALGVAGANFKTVCPLTNSSYINILVDSPDEDYSVPKFLTFHSTQQKLARFGTDIEQEMLMIEQDFTRIIKRIRSDLALEGDGVTITTAKLGLTDDAGTLALDPRDPATFIGELSTQLFKSVKFEGTKGSKYAIDLPYFRS